MGLVDETLPNCGEAACGKPWVDQNIGRTFAVTRRIGWDRRGKKRCQTACKPGSVPARGAGDDHSSGPPIAGRFSRPTRASRAVNPADRSPRDAPIRSCSRRGLPCRPRYRSRGGLLPHPFTLTTALPRWRFAFCCTVRHAKLAPRVPRRYLAICPAEPGLSSERRRSLEGPFRRFATVRPVTSVSAQYSGSAARAPTGDASEHRQHS